MDSTYAQVMIIGTTVLAATSTQLATYFVLANVLSCEITASLAAFAVSLRVAEHVVRAH